MCGSSSEQSQQIDPIVVAKTVEFYAAGVAAWYATRFEFDKSLLTLSAGGIGMLVTLISTVGVASFGLFVLHMVGLLCFIASLFALLAVFRLNSRHLEDVVVKEIDGHDPLLVRLDKVAVWAFVLGVVFSAIIGVSIALSSYQEGEKTMTEKKSSKGQSIVLRESVTGASTMRPTGTTTVNNSVTGVSGMRPVTSNSTQQTQSQGQSQGTTTQGKK